MHSTVSYFPRFHNRIIINGAYFRVLHNPLVSHICLLQAASDVTRALVSSNPGSSSDLTCGDGQTSQFIPSQIWKEIYDFVLAQLLRTSNNSTNVSWPDRVESLESEHVAAITAVTGRLLASLQSELCADTNDATGRTLGDGVSRTDLSAIADGNSVPPSIFDVFLRWIAKQSGAKYLDADGLNDDSSCLVALQAATPTKWQGTQIVRRTIVVSPTLGLQLLGGKATRGKLSDSATAGLGKVKPPQCIAIVKPCGDGSPVHGVIVKVQGQGKQTPIVHLTASQVDCKALGEALTAAGLKTGKFSHTYPQSRVAGEADDWSILAKVVTQVFGASSGAASPELQSKLLHLLLVYLILNVIQTGASLVPEAKSGDGGTGSGSFHDHTSPGNNNNGDEGIDKGSEGGGSGDSRKTKGQSHHTFAGGSSQTNMCRQNASSSSWSEKENLDPQFGPQMAELQMSAAGFVPDEELWIAELESYGKLIETGFLLLRNRHSAIKAANGVILWRQSLIRSYWNTRWKIAQSCLCFP